MHGAGATPIGPDRTDAVNESYERISIAEADRSNLENTFSDYMKLTFNLPWYSSVFQSLKSWLPQRK